MNEQWVRVWEDLRVHEARGLTSGHDELRRSYVLSMFSYPSGDLHMGHAEAYSISDAIARYLRMCGVNVLYPVGWDSFGLPAENAAFKRGLHPRDWTYANIETQAESLRRLGISFDWRTRLHTSDPEYYRWNQWLFLRLFAAGLAYRKEAPVNWCPTDLTVLANEQVIAGACERCGTTVVQRPLTQWFFKTTAYAQRLLDDMTLLEGGWPDEVLTMQRNWIGALHDWLVSRQRFWGTPIPIVHCDSCGLVPVAEADLPLLLPETGYELHPGDGRSPLASATAWVEVACPSCGRLARRDTDTMDTFVDSSWYFLRYPDPGYTGGPFDPAGMARWCPVDEYIGGREHATGHLMYARFITKALHDLGLVSFVEPFRRLTNHGQVILNGRSMSKSLGNLVDLQEQIARHGPDAVRVTMLFAGAPEDDIDWADVSPTGSVRWLARVRRLSADIAGADPLETPDAALRRGVHRLIADTTAAMEARRLNVAIARLMELTNLLRKAVGDPGAREGAEALVRMLSCFAPFTAEECWQRLGHEPSVAAASWPQADPELVARESVVCAIQVNGKLRDRIDVPPSIGEADLRERALASGPLRAYLGDARIERVVVRAPKLVNVVVSGSADA